MANINHRKRAAHRRVVQSALQQILNDPAVMPNASCPDLIVSVSRVEFGRTVREIYIDAFKKWRQSRDQWAQKQTDANNTTFTDRQIDLVHEFGHDCPGGAQRDNMTEQQVIDLYLADAHSLMGIGIEIRPAYFANWATQMDSMVSEYKPRKVQ